MTGSKFKFEGGYDLMIPLKGFLASQAIKPVTIRSTFAETMPLKTSVPGMLFLRVLIRKDGRQQVSLFLLRLVDENDVGGFLSNSNCRFSTSEQGKN